MLSEQLLFLKNGSVAGMGPANMVLTREFLHEVYDMDVASYMMASLKRWEQVS